MKKHSSQALHDAQKLFDQQWRSHRTRYPFNTWVESSKCRLIFCQRTLVLCRDSNPQPSHLQSSALNHLWERVVWPTCLWDVTDEFPSLDDTWLTTLESDHHLVSSLLEFFISIKPHLGFLNQTKQRNLIKSVMHHTSINYWRPLCQYTLRYTWYICNVVIKQLTGTHFACFPPPPPIHIDSKN